MSHTARFRDRLARDGRVSVDHVLLAAVVATWALLYLKGLGTTPIRTWDESRYVVPAMHVAEGGSWLDPQLQVNTHDAGLDRQIRLQKPPLLYWLQATAMEMFGVNEFASRLPSVLATLGIAGLSYHVGRVTYDRRAGFAAALLLIVFPGMLYGSHGGIAAVPDATLSLFGGLFVWLTWRGRDAPRSLLPAGICAGLAVMTKGIAAGAFVIVLLPVGLIWYRSYLTGWTVAAVASTVVVALPWHLYAYLEYGDEFVQDYFVAAVTQRVRGEAAGPPEEPLFEFMNYPYITYFFEAVLPPYQYGLPLFALGILVAFALVWWFVRRDGPRAHLDRVFCCWWVVAVPATFLLGGGNKAWYLMPMYMPGAVLLGTLAATLADGTFRAALADALDRVSPDLTDSVGTGDGAAADSVGTGDGAAADSVGTGDSETADPESDAVANGGPGPGSAERSRRIGPGIDRDLRGAVFPVISLLLVAVFLAATGPAIVEPYDHEQRDIGTAIAEEVPEDATVYVWLKHDEPPRSLMATAFYADRDLEKTTPEQLRTDESIRYAVVPYDERNAIERDHRVIATGPKNDVHVVAFTD